MTIEDRHPHSQAVRRVYENELPGATSGALASNIIHIACHPDPSSGDDIILWDDIKAAFDDVMHVRSGTFVIPFLKGTDLKNLDPLRIASVPGVTLDVIVRGRLSAAKELSMESLQTALPDNFPQDNLNSPASIPPASVPDFAEITMKAQLGDKEAQFAVGERYQCGRGVQQDYQAAMDWYLKAAVQGHADAQYRIGYLYQHGEGVPQDYSRAWDWFQKAIEQGHATAYNDIGYLYHHGLGICQDYSKAMECYHKAAEKGYAPAQSNIGRLYHNGQGVPEDYSQAMEWYLKAASQGNTIAQFYIGRMYVYGEGVPKDIVQANAWFKKVADGDAKKQLDVTERQGDDSFGGGIGNGIIF